MQPVPAQRWFLFACLIEGGLLAVAFGAARWFSIPLFEQIQPSLADALAGLAGTVPPLILFVWLLRSRAEPAVRVRQILEAVVKPVFGPWSPLQLGVLSLLAGISEEALFRGVLQSALEPALGGAGGAVAAGIIFGLCHLVTWFYALLAAMIGVYLSLLWSVTDNLLTPIVTHAVYDFVALLYFLRDRRR